MQYMPDIACIQLDVTGGGDATLPAGTQAKDLYKPDGELAKINVYSGSFNPLNVTIPGPPIWDVVSSSSGSVNHSNSGDEDKEGAKTDAITSTTDASSATTTDTGSPTITDTSAITTDTSISATNASPTLTKACRKRRRGVMKRAKRSHNPPLRRTYPNRLA